MQAISNTDDIIDSRDVIERIAELRELLEERGAICDAESEQVISADKETDLTAESEELATLESLAEEAAGRVPNWNHGATLIRDSYFVEYAQETAEDMGAIPQDMSWPANCIDWERAAREFQMDCAAVEFDGVTYWIR